MTENYFAAAVEAAPEVENTDPHTVLWHQTESIIEQAKSALSGGEHSTTPLLEGIVNPRVRDALLMFVVTNGNEDTMRDALWGEGALVNEAMDDILKGTDGPEGLADDPLRYLEEFVYEDMDVAYSNDEAKAQLYALAAVLAFWKNDEALLSRCLEGATRHGSNGLSNLVNTAVTRGIKPAWVAVS